MRTVWIIVFLIGSLGCAIADGQVTGRVIKFLPFYLDQQGRDSTSPSLFDRDAYQLHLRQHPKEISALRLDVQWKAVKAPDEKLKIRIELRGATHDGDPTLKSFESPVQAGYFSHWTKFNLGGDDFVRFGSLAAWRATLWNGDQLLGEQKSFLW
jgi:hypothetical protein